LIVTDDRVAKFVGEKLGFGVFPPYTCLGTEKDGEIIGGVIFNCFESVDLHATVAGRGFNRTFLKAVGDYVFNQLGYERITAITEDENIVMLAQRLGGELEGCLRNHFGRGRHGMICGILRDEYRFK